MVMRGEGPAKDEAKGAAALQGLCDDGTLEACTRLGFGLMAKPTAVDRRRPKALLTRACQGGQQDACSVAAQIR